MNGITTSSFDWSAVTWFDFAMGSTVIVSWLAVIGAVLAIRYANSQAKLAQARCQQLSHDLHIAGNSAIGMGQRIIALERKFSATDNQPAEHVQPIAPQSTLAKQAAPSNRVAVAKGSVTSIAVSAINPVLNSPVANSPVAKKNSVSASKQATNKTIDQTTATPPATVNPVAGNDSKQESVKKNPTPQITKKTQPITHMLPRVPGMTDKPTTADIFYRSTSIAASTNQPTHKPTLTPFEQANKLLKQGMSEAEVALRCGLSQSEAALMAMVLRQSKHAGAVAN